MTSPETTTPNAFTVTDSFDGRTIEVLTRISTTKLARKAAQKIANDYHDQVSLVRIDRHGQRHLIDLFEPQPAKPAGAVEATCPTSSTDTEPSPQTSGSDPIDLTHIPDFLRRTPQPTKPAEPGEVTPISRRSALIGACAATVVAVIPAAPVEAIEPLVALAADLKTLRAAGDKAFEVCQAAEDGAAEMRAEIAWEAIMDRAGVVERQVWDTPARGLQGVLIKLRESHFQLAQIDETEDTLESNFAVGIVGDVLGDLERLIAEARS